MELNELLKSINVKEDYNKSKMNISGISYHSGKVLNGHVFVCVRGYEVDGHKYLQDAVNNGAMAAIVEEINETINIPQYVVNNSREALAKLSDTFFGQPSTNLNLIGITGTNGKTTTTYILESIFNHSHKSMAIIGTNGVMFDGNRLPVNNTTPESLDLNILFSEMNQLNIDNCIMEVSSHGLELDRVHAIDFDTGIFTNLTPDHLELHKTMDNYFRAKAKLFKQTRKHNIINVDDEYGLTLFYESRNSKAQPISYAIDNKSDIYPTAIKYSLYNTTFTLNTPIGNIDIAMNLLGKVNLYNALAASACAYSNNIPLDIIKEGIEQVNPISGRFEIIYDTADLKVLIDFAHTEDALKQLLTTVRPFVKGKIILVFGVYADMSESGSKKRKGMGKVAATYADYSVITSDNPKFNNPEMIIEEVSSSVKYYNGDYCGITDRKEAIEHAIKISNVNDMVVIAGKGHETTQVIGSEHISFNEKEIALNQLEELSFTMDY